jgi:hypothetical protein
MSLPRVSAITDAYAEGRSWVAGFRKVPAIATTAAHWSDLSMAPGNPKPNYYVGTELTATLFDGTYGLYHGGAVAPHTKHLHQLLIGAPSSANAAGAYLLLDYLLFYPLVDMDSTDTQTMVNAVTLPRYTDGVGVQALLVATNPYLGGAGFYLDYIGADGVARQSQYEVSNTATLIGTVVHSGTAATSGMPFVRLARGERGIRRVEAITFLAPNGGLAALVLAKPLATVVVNEATAFAEHDLLIGKASLPRIHDGAYLNLLTCPTGSLAAVPLTGTLSVIWN